MTVQLTADYLDALDFAIRTHAAQTRKGTDIPYISHLLAVSAIVLEFGGSEDQAIAALLHDAVEDGGGQNTRLEIAERVGEEVAQIVDGCSDDSPAPGEPKRPWMERKTRHLEHIAHASPSVRFVTAADKLHNARALVSDLRSEGSRLWDRFNARPDQILWYYGAMVEALRDTHESEARASNHDTDNAGLARLITELAFAVEELVDQAKAAGTIPAPDHPVVDFVGVADMKQQHRVLRGIDEPTTR
jgi:(p)ppGpp synthase/HD superfamily hydrolase